MSIAAGAPEQPAENGDFLTPPTCRPRCFVPIRPGANPKRVNEIKCFDFYCLGDER